MNLINKTFERLQAKYKRIHDTPKEERTLRDKGNAALIGVLIALALTGLMLSLAGPDMLDILRGARGQKLEANFQQAVSVVEARIQQEPEWLNTSGTKAGSTSTGTATSDFLDVLISDGADFNWQSGWLLQDADDDTTIRVQFILDGTLAISSTAGSAPVVDWLVRDAAAVRLQARNSDGAWVCALVIARPSVTNSEAQDEDNYLKAANTKAASGDVSSNTGRRISAWLGGTWYDQGDSYTDSAASARHCDPVGLKDATNLEAWYPYSGSSWRVAVTANASSILSDKELNRTLN